MCADRYAIHKDGDRIYFIYIIFVVQRDRQTAGVSYALSVLSVDVLVSCHVLHVCLSVSNASTVTDTHRSFADKC